MRLSFGQSQDAHMRMRAEARGQKVLKRATLMEYALGGAILGQEKEITRHAMRYRAEPQRPVADADTTRGAGNEPRERAGDHIGAGTDLPGDAENFSARRDQRQVLYTASDVEAFHNERIACIRPGGPHRIMSPNGRPSISSISCSRVISGTAWWRHVRRCARR